MEHIADHIEFVKNQQAFHERQAVRFSNDLRRKELHSNTAKRFKSLAGFLEQLQAGGHNAGKLSVLSGGHYQLALTRDEVEGLPEELMNELSVSDADKAEFNIIDLIDQAGGVATLDRLLVALYRQSGEIMKRANLNARLYRMTQKGLLYSAPGKKGVYSTTPFTEEDIEKLR